MLSYDEATSLNVIDTVTAKERFIDAFKTNWGKSEEEANSFYIAERIAFKSALEDEKIAKCLKDSILSAFITVAMKGLSIKDKYLAYLEPSYRRGKDNQSESVCLLKITIKGELTERIRSGHLKYATDVVIVYEGDTIDVEDIDGKGVTVKYKMAIPRKSNKIIMAYVYLVMPNNDKRLSIFQMNDIERLKEYSLKKNKTSANALYTSDNGQIDTGFLKAKTIRHALNGICKDSLKAVVKDSNTVYEADDEEETENTPVMNETPKQENKEELPF